jgi:hypothetical protein
MRQLLLIPGSMIERKVNVHLENWWPPAHRDQRRLSRTTSWWQMLHVSTKDVLSTIAGSSALPELSNLA